MNGRVFVIGLFPDKGTIGGFEANRAHVTEVSVNQPIATDRGGAGEGVFAMNGFGGTGIGADGFDVPINLAGVG